MLHQENIKITMVRGGSKWRDKNFIFFSEGLILLFIFLIISSQLKSEKRKEEKIFSWGIGVGGYIAWLWLGSEVCSVAYIFRVIHSLVFFIFANA